MTRARSNTGSPEGAAATYAHNWGAKRVGARVRSLIIDPQKFDIDRITGEEERPLITLGIGKGGAGGEVRLKLWLSLVFRTRGDEEWMGFAAMPHEFFAGMFGLNDPRNKGASRVRAAYRWLEANRFLEVHGSRISRRGRLRLLSEAAQFLPDEVPPVHTPPQGKTVTPEFELFPRYTSEYFTVPRELWEHGWISHLTSAELVLLMILCYELRNKTSGSLKFPAHRFEGRFGLSDEMWSKGTSGLRRRGVLRSVETEPVTDDPYDIRQYEINRVLKINGSSVAEALKSPISGDRQKEITRQLG